MTQADLKARTAIKISLYYAQHNKLKKAEDYLEKIPFAS